MAAISPYFSILILLVIVLLVVLVLIVLTHLIGVKRRGPRKDAPYEAGMPVVIDARRRFHARYYIIALLFLLFDVEVVLLWPWALVYHRAASTGKPVVTAGAESSPTFLLVSMLIFFALLVIGLIYERGQGVLQLK